MENDLSLLGYDMTVDEFTGWKVDQGLASYDTHESILDEDIQQLNEFTEKVSLRKILYDSPELINRLIQDE